MSRRTHYICELPTKCILWWYHVLMEPPWHMFKCICTKHFFRRVFCRDKVTGERSVTIWHKWSGHSLLVHVCNYCLAYTGVIYDDFSFCRVLQTHLMLTSTDLVITFSFFFWGSSQGVMYKNFEISRAVRSTCLGWPFVITGNIVVEDTAMDGHS